MAENFGSHVYISCDFPMNYISFCHQSFPSHHSLSENLVDSSLLGFFFLGTLLFLFTCCQSCLIPWRHCETYAFQCRLQSLSVPLEHSPRRKGERGGLEWHHSWKTNRRWKMSMNSRLFSGSLNSTYVLVPNVIHGIFWTFRVAKLIGNQSWTRRIRWNTAVGGHMSLCPLQSRSLLAKLCEKWTIFVFWQFWKHAAKIFVKNFWVY